MRYVSGTKLDERIIRCDLDLGYKEGRQFGRGKSGGQVRDEHRQDYDPGRGGWGAQAQRLEIERRREVEERYADAQEGPGAVAGGGGDWKQEDSAVAEKSLKRARSEEEEADTRQVGLMVQVLRLGLTLLLGTEGKNGRYGGRENVESASWSLLLYLQYAPFLSLRQSRITIVN